jgi:uncharacterized C2H2 Zn-finger protein
MHKDCKLLGTSVQEVIQGGSSSCSIRGLVGQQSLTLGGSRPPRSFCAGMKQFKCALCDQRYSEQKALNRHMRVAHLIPPAHTPGVNQERAGEFPCPAEGCSKLYKKRGKLEQHLRECHVEYLRQRALVGVPACVSDHVSEILELEVLIVPPAEQADAPQTSASGSSADIEPAGMRKRKPNGVRDTWCNFPGCTFGPLTRKSMMAHCSKVHGWSLILERLMVKK